LQKASDLIGKSLAQVQESITQLDGVSRVITKGGAAYVTEDYFGIRRNSTAAPDFPQLGIELKSVPLKERNGKLTVKEPLSLNMIDYFEEAKCDDITQSSLYKKNKELLLVCYLHSGSKRSEYVFMYAFLWKMDDAVLEELRPDFNLIVEKIRAGNATELHQEYNRWLCTCPKHGGDFDDPDERKSKVRQPFSPILAERKAYRLKTSYMSTVIARRFGLSLEKNGRGSEQNWWRDA